MLLSLSNLRAGIAWWSNQDARTWAPDFLNREYYAIYDARASGPNADWLDRTAERLVKWRAHRPSLSKADIVTRGRPLLSTIERDFRAIVAGSSSEPSIADCRWLDVAALFELAAAIKGTDNPMFAAKMVHFLLPNVFVVLDTVATDHFRLAVYEAYWRGVRDAWCEFADVATAKAILAQSIGDIEPIHPGYPFETKIIELCQIGASHLS